MCSHIQDAQSGSHTIVVAGTQKAATKVLALKKHKLLLRNIATKKSIRKERKQYPFTPQIRYFDFPKSQMPSHIKHMTKESIPGKLPPTEKCIKDLIEIHNINQRDGESMKEFVRRYKLECSRTKAKLQEGKLSEQTKDGTKTRHIHPSSKTPKEILALDKEEFKPPSSMTIPVEKRNAGKFCEFHGEPWQRIARKRITQTFSQKSIISFLTLGEEDETKGPMIIEAEMGGNCVYRMITGRPGVRKIRAIPSTAHGMLKFHVAGGIVTLRSNRIIPLECSMVSEPEVPRLVINQVLEEKIQVAVHPEYLKQTIAIGSTLTEEGRKELCGLLRRHLDVFAQKPTDMTRVPRHIAEHRPNVREGCLPVRQKKKGPTPERNKAIGEEVKKLVEADIMKEFHYHSWLSNPVMELIMYLAAAKESISVVLMTERDGRQVPIYFLSRALQGPEINYTLMEKSILALVSADFIMERLEDDTPDTLMEDMEELPDPWILFTNGSSCIDCSRAGLIIMNPKGMEFTYALWFRFNATNNEAKYEALIAGLCIAGQMGVQNLQENVDSKLVANQVLVEELREKSIDEKEILAVIEEEGHTWMTPVYEYLTEGILPEEKKKARVVRCKAGRYAENYVLREIHEGSCSMHAGPRSVVAKALRSGYYWPTMHTDARNLIRECNDCQGIDIAVPFLEGPGKVKFLIVAMDYFTKWIEERQHPQANGLVERANRILGEGTKVRLGDKNKNWVEEISHVLWAHRTMMKSSNRETPFSLTYEAGVVIAAEIDMPTLRTAEVDIVKNNEALGISLGLLEEKREQAAIREARSKAKMERYYNARVRNTSSRPGDFVYRNNEASHKEDEGKLGPKWEGPYEVTKALRKGAYRIKDHNGHTLPRTWNICNLKKMLYA
nr:hypothetical protein [Tanacetum cinerariifolium]